MPVENTSRTREITAVLVTSAVLLGIYALIQNPVVQDIWRGWQYQEPASVSEIRESLELTGTGERIFLATQPAIEAADSFNEHCDSHRADVSLLGCYTGDKVYIYEVQAENLQDAHKVTAAHELLHAAWKRLSNGEREDVTDWLQEVRWSKADWVQEELALYEDGEQTEELYTRVGTKLRDIPEGLEKHYAKYFTNRLKIVEYYENYQAPFNELKAKNAALYEQIQKLNQEVSSGRTEYNKRIAELDRQIKSFNQCAETEGCFSSKESFQAQRERLEAEKVRLDELRASLNAKIDQNNQLVNEYQQNQAALGELNNALNSNMEKI